MRPRSTAGSRDRPRKQRRVMSSDALQADDFTTSLHPLASHMSLGNMTSIAVWLTGYLTLVESRLRDRRNLRCVPDELRDQWHCLPPIEWEFHHVADSPRIDTRCIELATSLFGSAGCAPACRLHDRPGSVHCCSARCQRGFGIVETGDVGSRKRFLQKRVEIRQLARTRAHHRSQQREGMAVTRQPRP